MLGLTDSGAASLVAAGGVRSQLNFGSLVEEPTQLRPDANDVNPIEHGKRWPARGRSDSEPDARRARLGNVATVDPDRPRTEVVDAAQVPLAAVHPTTRRT